MRVGKKPNVVDAKKTRSCVVRLEKVTRNSTSPASSSFQESPQQRITRNNRLSITAMAPTPKGRKLATPQQEEKTIKGPIKKRPAGLSSNPQTPQQQKPSTTNMPIRSTQKVKIGPKPTKATPISTPVRDETPTPTIAAGRSRRAIKPNPKYASEDLVTPKVVRTLVSTATKGGSSAQSGGNSGSKQRRISISSDDFYNDNSDDDFNKDSDNEDDDDDPRADKPYQVNRKESQEDSDFTDDEDVASRNKLQRGRSKKIQETRVSMTTQQTSKWSQQAPISNIKRTNISTATNQRSAPSQLQQIRRSLATANAQRNINLLAGSGAAQKRKLEESLDSSENESSFTTTRKQMLLTSATGAKVKVPIKDNKISITSTPINNKTRTMGIQKSSATPQQSVNGGNKINTPMANTTSRKIMEIPAKISPEVATKMSMRSLPNRQPTATSVNNKPISNKPAEQPRPQQQQQQTTTTQTKMFAEKTAASANRLRSGSPKPTATQKDAQSNTTSTTKTTTQSSATFSSQNSAPAIKKLPILFNSNKMGDKPKSLLSLTSKTNNSSASTNDTTTSTPAQAKTTNMKAKFTPPPPPPVTAPPKTFTPEKSIEIQEDSPNSTMDDFETMPTFTIVNVNDIINKKGDVLITKSKCANKQPTIIEFTESISLDDDDDDDEVTTLPPSRALPATSKTIKLPTLNNKQDVETKKSPLTRSSNDSLRKSPATQFKNTAISSSSTSSSTPAPQILNHQLGLRNSRATPKATTTVTLAAPEKPAPRILNSVVAKKTQPVKPMIANLDDSADESFPLSLDEDEEEETEDEEESKPISSNATTANKKDQDSSLMEVDAEDTESQNTEENDSMLPVTAALTPKSNTLPATQRKKRAAGHVNVPIVVSSNKKRMTPAAAKENSLAATNQQINEAKSPTTASLPRKNAAEKVVISKMGDKIIKKITCFETWYVLNMPLETKRQMVIKNQMEMPLIKLANKAKTIELPTDLWSSKVTLYELSALTLSKSTFVTYTGDLSEHNIKEEDRGKYQPSCVMFRRSIDNRIASRMPYDRAVIFKNKTFYTNIEGKNVRLIGAPSIINSEREIEILLEVVDALTLQSEFVEHVSIVP